MTTYYCDLGAAFVADRSGADSSTNVLTGPGGFATLVNGWDTGSVAAITAGDTVYLKGTAALSKFVKLTVGSDKTATWLPGDAVRNDTGDGDDWTGTLVKCQAAALWIDLTSGTYSAIATGDGVENTTRSDTVTCSAKACPGIVIEAGKSPGTNVAPIMYVGVNSSWETNYNPNNSTAYQAIFDGEDVATNCWYRTDNTGFQYSNVVTCTFKQATGAGWSGGNGGGDFRGILFHCQWSENGNVGVHAYNFGLNHTVYVQCIASNNSSTGFYYCYGTLFACAAHGNGGGGLYYTAIPHYCLFYDNTTSGYENSYGGQSVWLNNVIDDNGTAGIDMYASTPIVLVGCRITNNGTYGVKTSYIDAGHELYTFAWSLARGNTTANYDGQKHTLEMGVNYLSGSGDGYVDQANRDYNLASDADLRSEAIVLDWA